MDVASIVVGIVALVYLWMWVEMKHLVTCGYGWNFGTWLLVDVGRTEALGYLWMWLVFWHLFASESSQTWLFMEIARIVALWTWKELFHLVICGPGSGTQLHVYMATVHSCSWFRALFK